MEHLNLLNHNNRDAAMNAEVELRCIVLAGQLTQNQSCEGDITAAERIALLVPQVNAAAVAALPIEAREQKHLRHTPLLLVREMARHASHRALVAATLARIIQHANELAEFVALYWKDGRQPLSAQVKKGLAAAFVKFDAGQLAKYDRVGPVHLRDVLFLCHPRPLDVAQEVLWEQLAEGGLACRSCPVVDDADGGQQATRTRRVSAS